MGYRMDLLKDRFIDLFTHSQQSFLTDTFSRNPKSRSHVIRTAVQKLDTLFITKSSQKQQQTLISYIDCLIGSDLSACRIFLTEIKNKHIDPNLFKPFVSALGFLTFRRSCNSFWKKICKERFTFVML